jgi:apolipoprotein N-acyltransferase
MTNDAWYGKSSAQEQHTAIASFQVYQTLKPMVRSTNNGQTTMITPFERSDLAPFTSTFTSYDVPLFSDSSTFYVWTYPLMEWIWWLIFVIAAMWKSDRRTKKIFFPN